jgi:hypothetical protein
MEKRINVDKYDDLCDKIRSLIIYSEAFRRKNERRKENVQDLCGMIHKDTIRLINKVKSLEELMNDFDKEINEDDS